MSFRKWLFSLSLSLVFAGQVQAQDLTPEWPEVTHVTRPWTRWWWMGNAVDETGLTSNMEAYRKVGLGGLEITPIYGVRGAEERFIPFLSDTWNQRFSYTLREAKRLDLGIDVAQGTGWPFGGPMVDSVDASKHVAFKQYELKAGESLTEAVESIERPVRRLQGGDIPDQIRKEEPLSLVLLMAYPEKGQAVDLTNRVKDGRLEWTAPAGSWKLYAVFQGLHGKHVERAAPGGEGLVIDHFSPEAIDRYLAHFNTAFGIGGFRAVFNDSYEVDDAAGQADWTPRLFEEFRRRRGYDLKNYLPALFGHDTPERSARVRQDYRETISDLILDTFTRHWTKWANDRGLVTRNQAHGSPANILDLYQASDIPETEGTEFTRAKFGTSAAHVSGKPLAAAEAATWLGEHFTSTLADVKEAVDRYFLAGVNHIVYHGTDYSPPGEAWPGWLFYAAVHFHPSNPFWQDFSALNAYVTRSQSFLQAGHSANDVLLYFPIYDRYARSGRGMLEHFDRMDASYDSMAFKVALDSMQSGGYSFDFISDRQIRALKADGKGIVSNGTTYRVLLIPASKYMPLETLEGALRLAEAGATVAFYGSLPEDVPGLNDLANRQTRLATLKRSLQFRGDLVGEARRGRGRVLLSSDLIALLAQTGARKESMVTQELQYVRRAIGDDTVYFIVNPADRPFEGWVQVATPARAVALFDPMTGSGGLAHYRPNVGGTEVYLQLQPKGSAIVRLSNNQGKGATYAYRRTSGEPKVITGTWDLTFTEGGPTLPPAAKLNTLHSWTELGEPYQWFSGTARYCITFARPEGQANGWVLDLGRVAESAHVYLNGQSLGTLIGPSFQLPIAKDLLRDSNVLEVDVSNSMANRIIDLDRRQVPWKKFYNVNFSANQRKNVNEKGLFDASKWEPFPSGLLGPVTLTSYTEFARP